MSSNSSSRRLRDREDAGRRLAGELVGRSWHDPIVIALPRGGVPVAREIAAGMGAALGILLVRKIGSPGNPELAAGALVGVDEPEIVLNEDVVASLGISAEWIRAEAARKAAENRRRREAYGDVARDPRIEGRDVVLVDDGMATGASFRVAVRAVRARRPRKIVAALPVAPPSSLAELAGDVDETVCLLQPRGFGCVAAFYDEFPEVSDDAVVALLEDAAAERRRESTGR